MPARTPSPATLKKLRSLYVDFYTVTEEAQRLGSVASVDPTTREKEQLQRTELLQRLVTDIIPALSTAEKKCNTSQLTKIRATLRSEGVIPAAS